jgi:D-alanyl-lipoteichoic acid acyltransferase DltB (MBOAT superfamily)
VSPFAFLAFYLVACAAAFVVGLRFFRMSAPPNESVSVDQARRFGRLLMMAATMMLVFIGALWFHGDLKAMRI